MTPERTAYAILSCISILALLTLGVQLYGRRMDMIKSHPPLHKHLLFMKKLGRSGMSSDETDEERDSQGHLKVFVKEWRHPQVAELMKTLDTLYMINRRSSRRGPMPTPRRVTTVVDKTRHEVSGLPRNAYSPAWLESIGEEMVKVLNISGEHDFSCPPAIQS